MKIISSVILLTMGAAFGVGMTLSCGNDSPHHADAATCDCSPSEAPIAGRTVVIEATPQTIQPGQTGGVGTGCMPGMQFLSGSCLRTGQNTQNITLVEFGFDKATLGWGCIFKNNDAIPVTVNASVLCLKPAP